MTIINIFVTGFMGSGKTRLASLVASSLGFHHYDTDLLLEEKQGIPVAEQLANDPVTFRCREAELIAQLISLDRGIISLGGGAIENADTRALLKGKLVVFLDPGVDVCWQRVQADTQQRPLATDYDFFVALYEKRLPLYLSVCRWHLTDNLPPEQLVNKLETIINHG